MYIHEEGVTQNYKAAFKWAKLAAEQGYAEAWYSLGWLYVRGQGVLQDPLRGYMCWDIAETGITMPRSLTTTSVSIQEPALFSGLESD